ncbi:Cystathionine beta-synthase [Ceratobasidium theobromae]|uniref:cystathionine beta-synthase n=1 Tax=Ceratobasidium theobromae TaxID=1582974 RepID=A0A5N5QE98_9AGAM|nr:Cystathionine beta-synthase [Ceratobasidium theobromae]
MSNITLTRPLVLENALEGIGYTPLVRLDRLAKANGIKIAKVEFMSIGGSVKDRIAKRMVEQAEKDGILIPGKSIVIEPTSGNTGIGLALACAVRGYPLIITLPEKMSMEKELTMRALGAEIIRTPTEAASDSPLSNLGVAKRLKESIPNAVILDQYRNPNNPLAHELTTGPEIVAAIESLPGNQHVDVLVAGAGTGGTITGTARALKKHNKNCTVVGVDPRGSVLALPDSLNSLGEGENIPYQVEGIGYDFVPDVLSREPGLINHWVKVTDGESFKRVREIMRLEALLVGGSSGAAISGALSWLKGGPDRDVEGQNVVIMLPDGLRNYMSKPWFADGLLGREVGADLAPEVTAQIHKVLADNYNYSLSANGEVSTKPKAEAAVSALTDSMKDVTIGVRNVNGVNGVNGVIQANNCRSLALDPAVMTTIPSRLARVSQTSANLLDARRRAIQLYRDWYRSAPEIVSAYGLNIPPSLIRHRVREKFEQMRYIADPAVLDVLLHKGRLEYQETMNCWKQEPHIMGMLLQDMHEGSAVGQTFLQKFYAGRDDESVRIASPP